MSDTDTDTDMPAVLAERDALADRVKEFEKQIIGLEKDLAANADGRAEMSERVEDLERQTSRRNAQDVVASAIDAAMTENAGSFSDAQRQAIRERTLAYFSDAEMADGIGEKVAGFVADEMKYVAGFQGDGSAVQNQGASEAVSDDDANRRIARELAAEKKIPLRAAVIELARENGR